MKTKKQGKLSIEYIVILVIVLVLLVVLLLYTGVLNEEMKGLLDALFDVLFGR